MSYPSISDKLVFSASANNLEYVRRHLNEGADPNHVVPNKGSALYAGSLYPLIVSTLLEAGADPNAFVSPDGNSSLDRALSLGTAAHSALILHRAGAKARKQTIRDDLSGTIVAALCVPVGQHLNRMITCGMVAFGEFGGDNRIFEWGELRESGYLVTLDGINSSTNKPIFYIRQESYVFHLIDYHDNKRTIVPGDCEDLVLDAVFTIHKG